jgi:hypothetical protein
VVDGVDRLIDEVGLDDVDVQMDEVVVPQVRDVRERSGLEVVNTDHAVAATEELFTQVRAEEPGAAGDEASRHRGQST